MQLCKNIRTLREKFYPCVLMPGLVNAHMHLELSYLANCIEPGGKRNFTDWIDALIAAKNHKKSLP